MISSDAKEMQKKLAGVFNAALGDQDQGKDPGVFEVDLLVRRLTRIEAAQKIVTALDALRKLFADDMLNTGAMVVEPRLKVLEASPTAMQSSVRCWRQ